jgi:hypothetical protein
MLVRLVSRAMTPKASAGKLARGGGSRRRPDKPDASRTCPRVGPGRPEAPRTRMVAERSTLPQLRHILCWQKYPNEPKISAARSRGVHESGGTLSGPIRIRGATGDVDPPTAKLNEEQHIEASEPERLNREEITGEHRPGVRPQELTPADPSTRASGRHTRQPKDLGDRRRRNPHADTRQLADDPLITPARVLTRKAQPTHGSPQRPPVDPVAAPRTSSVSEQAGAASRAACQSPLEPVHTAKHASEQRFSGGTVNSLFGHRSNCLCLAVMPLHSYQSQAIGRSGASGCAATAAKHGLRS